MHEIKTRETKMPLHIALTVEGTSEWARENGIDSNEAYKKRFEVVRKIMDMQSEFKIPVITFFIMPARKQKHELLHLMLDSIAEFLEELDKSMIAHKHNIKISIIGKWYDLPSRIIDPIKKIIAETKDYDRFLDRKSVV